MSESPAHSDLIHYLRDVLEWNLREGDWEVFHDIGFYQTPDVMEYPLAPDISVFNGVNLTDEDRRKLRSWRMLEANRPAPALVFEVSSDETYKEDIDLDKKPAKYGLMGVQEYFAYDPNDPPSWRIQRKKTALRLMGWRYTPGGIEEIKPDARGWLECRQLGLWLAQDEGFLRFYDHAGNMLLTRSEAAEAQQAAEQAARLIAEKQAEAERTARFEALKKAEEEQKARIAAEQQVAQKQAELELLLQKLREKGINPDSL